MKKVALITIASVALFSLAACSSSTSEQNSSASSTTSKKASAVSKKLTPEERAIQGLQGNSLAQTKTAISYLKTQNMSKQGLYDQLTSEYGSKMTAEEANAVINKLDPLVNWNNLAILSAKSYRDTMNLTGQGLSDQLTSEYGSKFTPEQAQYAVAHIDDDVKSGNIWN